MAEWLRMVRARRTAWLLRCAPAASHGKRFASAAMRARIYEVPISYHGRTYKEGKKIGWKDGVAAIWYIVKYNLFGR